MTMQVAARTIFSALQAGVLQRERDEIAPAFGYQVFRERRTISAWRLYLHPTRDVSCINVVLIRSVRWNADAACA